MWHTDTCEWATMFAKALDKTPEVDEMYADAGQLVMFYGFCVAIGGRCDFGEDAHDRGGQYERNFVLRTPVHAKLWVKSMSTKASVAPTIRGDGIRFAVRTRQAATDEIGREKGRRSVRTYLPCRRYAPQKVYAAALANGTFTTRRALCMHCKILRCGCMPCVCTRPVIDL